jgi:hypothetical protein
MGYKNNIVFKGLPRGAHPYLLMTCFVIRLEEEYLSLPIMCGSREFPGCR